MATHSKQYLGLDFETFSDVSLPVHGRDRYMSGAEFTPLIGSVAFRHGLSPSGGLAVVTYDFVFNGALDEALMFEVLEPALEDRNLVAHNLGFEEGVLRHLRQKSGEEHDWLEGALARGIDSAILTRKYGAASSLEASSAQLLGQDKMPEGKRLIMKFSVPNEWNNFHPPTRELIEKSADDLRDWKRFIEYCELDAKLSLFLAEHVLLSDAAQDEPPQRELLFGELTRRMNRTGWHVDMPLVQEMQIRYENNVAELMASFQSRIDSELNFNSPLQLKKWCEARGIKAKSFDSETCAKLLSTLEKKIDTMTAVDPRYAHYQEVYEMLTVKKELGGSALKKLQTILDNVGLDHRLRDQYIHCGAGQSYRTSGVSVQMQNLKRLSGDLLDMETLYDQDQHFDNETMAANLRQVFTASHPEGRLIVGDFSSIESRVLAWLAGADWKVDAFAQGKDMYKVAAEGIYHLPYHSIDKAQRQVGKVAELSCGYGGGVNAVQRFASIYGLDMPAAEMSTLVYDWRRSNPEVVAFWDTIDTTLHSALQQNARVSAPLAHGLILEFAPIETPATLRDQHPGAVSLEMKLRLKGQDNTILSRVFHGCYVRGRNVCYYKPSMRKTGALWSASFTDPTTKKDRFYDIYGGKLAGILTQSLAREMFFYGLESLMEYTVPRDISGEYFKVIGQFHDEIVVEWAPGHSELSLERAIQYVQGAMTTTLPGFQGFPLEADVKSDYRYTK